MQYVDNNSPYTNSPYSSTDSFEDAVNWAYDAVCTTTQKLSELGQKYLAPEFLYQKAKNATKAKILPLSNPAGWDEKMQKARETEVRLKALMQSVETQIKQAEIELTSIESQRLSAPVKAQKMQKAEEKLNQLKDRHEGLQQSTRRNQELITFYEQQRAAQIGGRFAGYVGMATNAVIPGAGLITSLAVTGTTTFAQENLVNNLSEDNPRLEQERKNVRISTLCTIACTIASIAFSIWAMPIIKDAILTSANNAHYQ